MLKLNVHVKIEKKPLKKSTSLDTNKRTSLKWLIKCKKLCNFILFKGDQDSLTQPYQTTFLIFNEKR